MRTKLLVLLSVTFLLILSIILHSCKRDSDDLKSNVDLKQRELREEADKYFRSQLKVKVSKDSNDVNITMYSPDWSTVAFGKTSDDLDYIAVQLKNTENELIELNVTIIGENTYGIIKRYLKTANKLQYLSGSGRLLTTIDYNFAMQSTPAGKYGNFKTLDIYGGELDEVPVYGGGGGSGGDSGGGDGWGGGLPTGPSTGSGGSGGDGGSGDNGGGSGGYSGGYSSSSIGNRFQIDWEIKYYYPKFAQMLTNMDTWLQQNPRVLDALIKYSGFEKNKVLQLVRDKNGPTIKLVSERELAGGRADGKWTKGDPNNIYLSRESLKVMENSTNLHHQNAYAFSIAATLLHETVHYGRFQNGLVDENKPEYGQMFEILGFGWRVEFQNNQLVNIDMNLWD